MWVYFGEDEHGKKADFFRTYGIFIAAALFGAAGSAVLITSLSLTAELISNNTESAAFVYGAMSFTDKVSNGLAVMVIQHYIPCPCKWYFRDVSSSTRVGGAALLGLVFLATLAPFSVGKRWRDRRCEAVTTPSWRALASSCASLQPGADSGEDQETSPLLGPGRATSYS